jgi:hypothetical protein
MKRRILVALALVGPALRRGHQPRRGGHPDHQPGRDLRRRDGRQLHPHPHRQRHRLLAVHQRAAGRARGDRLVDGVQPRRPGVGAVRRRPRHRRGRRRRVRRPPECGRHRRGHQRRPGPAGRDRPPRSCWWCATTAPPTRAGSTSRSTPSTSATRPAPTCRSRCTRPAEAAARTLEGRHKLPPRGAKSTVMARAARTGPCTQRACLSAAWTATRWQPCQTAVA